MSSSSQHSIGKVEGEPVQEDVGGTQSELLKMSEKVDGYSFVDYMAIPREEFISKYTGWPYRDDPSKIQKYDTDHPDPVSGGKICRGCGTCCDRKAVDFPSGNFPRGNLWNPKNRYLSAIPGMLVPSYAWPFVDTMTAKSDDKTLVVSHITREIRKETDFLKLFEPFGEVSSLKLAPLDPEGTCRGGFGFVTFVNKEDAQKAMDTLNVSGPRGCDNRTLALDWASTLKKPT